MKIGAIKMVIKNYLYINLKLELELFV